MDVRTIRASTIDPEGFAPFGRVLGTDDAAPDERVVGRFSNGQQPMPSVIREFNPDGVPHCDWLARHLDQTQALTPIDGPIVVVLGPPGTDPTSETGFAALRAFVADIGEGLQIDEGVWHWAAAVGRVPVRVANVQGHRWPEDNEIVSLADTGLAAEPRHRLLDAAWAAELLAVGTAALGTGPGARSRPDRVGSVRPGTAAPDATGDIWTVADRDGVVAA